MSVAYGIPRMSMKNENLQSLPSVDKLLNARDIQVLKESFGRSLVTEAVRSVLNKERESILKNNNVQVSNYNDLANKIENLLQTNISVYISKQYRKATCAIYAKYCYSSVVLNIQTAIFCI